MKRINPISALLTAPPNPVLPVLSFANQQVDVVNRHQHRTPGVSAIELLAWTGFL